MKPILGLILSISVLIAACSSQGDLTHPPIELLADKKGKYNFLVVHPERDVGGYQVPIFMQELEPKLKDVLTGGIHTMLDGTQNKYPSLEIEKAPYFIFFDTDDIVFETDNENEAAAFLKEKLNDKRKSN
jgi:hypothetical protein